MDREGERGGCTGCCSRGCRCRDAGGRGGLVWWRAPFVVPPLPHLIVPREPRRGVDERALPPFLFMKKCIDPCWTCAPGLACNSYSHTCVRRY